MRLTLDQLRGVVRETLNDERSAATLCLEVRRLLGHSVNIQGSLVEVAERANDRLYVLEQTDRSVAGEAKLSVLLRFIEHKSTEVRKLVANLLPSRLLVKMTRDPSVSVRYAVARRVPLDALREMSRRHPKDDELKTICGLREAAGYEPDITVAQASDEPLGDSVKQSDEPGLSESFYESLAHKLIQDYDVNVIESNWIPSVVRQYVNNNRVFKRDVDESKLRKAIEKQLKELEDRHLERDALKETMAWLGRRIEPEMIVMPIIEEVEAVPTPASYSSATEAVVQISKRYRVREAELPPFIKKYRLGEGRLEQIKVPMSARTPHGGSINESDERMMDAFVSAWTSRQAIDGEPLKLSWHPSPMDASVVNFAVELK